VALIDVVPTLLDATGVATDSLLRGFSLVPYLRGDAGFERPPVFSQKGQPKWKELAAMVDWPWKAIWKVRTNRFELYRLDQDPHEIADLAMSQPARMTEMANHMRAWRASLDPPAVFSYGK
jgi:arylsulfatase A-like enzyme